MPRYLTAPVEVEAFQMTYAIHREPAQWPEWVREAYELPVQRVGSITHLLGNPHQPMVVRTHHGVRMLCWGDYLVKLPAGDLEVCPEAEFSGRFIPMEVTSCPHT